MARRPIRLKDIAAVTGVTANTVSLALRGSTRIPEETRERIVAAARKLNYLPNQVAQSLVSRETKTVGLILTSIVNPILTQAARAIERELAARGYSLMLSASENDIAKETEALNVFRSRQVDGMLIYAASHGTLDHIRSAPPRGLPDRAARQRPDPAPRRGERRRPPRRRDRHRPPGRARPSPDRLPRRRQPARQHREAGRLPQGPRQGRHPVRPAARPRPAWPQRRRGLCGVRRVSRPAGRAADGAPRLERPPRLRRAPRLSRPWGRRSGRPRAGGLRRHRGERLCARAADHGPLRRGRAEQGRRRPPARPDQCPGPAAASEADLHRAEAGGARIVRKQWPEPAATGASGDRAGLVASAAV